MTRHYELLFVLKPTLVDEEVQARITFLKETLEKNGAEISAFQNMGTRKLAYKIEKFERGYYGVFYFTAPSLAIGEVERNIRINEDFIKFMSVKYENQKELRHWNKIVEKCNKQVTTTQPVDAPVQETEASPEA
ncbi:MAG: 30S ribosomal protein S6 [Sulfurospirillum sp.]|nr:30S ribosomal protein S6 [Sulfurospirillum sp.]